MLACPHPDVGLPGAQHTLGPAEDHVSWHVALFLTLSNGFVVFALGSSPPVPPRQATLFSPYFIPLTWSLCHFSSTFALLQFLIITSSLFNVLICICYSVFISIMALLIFSSVHAFICLPIQLFIGALSPEIRIWYRNSNTVIQKALNYHTVSFMLVKQRHKCKCIHALPHTYRKYTSLSNMIKHGSKFFEITNNKAAMQNSASLQNYMF